MMIDDMFIERFWMVASFAFARFQRIDDAGLATSFSHDINVNVPYLKVRNSRKIEAHCMYYIETT